MAEINWIPEYTVNVKLLDGQHKGMLTFMNEVYERADNVIILSTEVEDFFTHIRAYFQEHFQTEEKYFDLFKYEDVGEHKKVHAQFLVDIDDLLERYHGNKTKDSILFELIQILENHLVVHIMALDKKYTKCFNQHGLY